MSELGKLVGKGKKIKLGEIEIEIKPLTVSYMPLLMEMGNESNKSAQATAMKEILVHTLKEAVPDATEEEIDKIPIEYMNKLMEAIMDVNKLEEMDPQKKQFLEKLKNERSGTAGN